jgi:hypothetical protein
MQKHSYKILSFDKYAKILNKKNYYKIEKDMTNKKLSMKTYYYKKY